jgi:hypothetical protein
LPLPKPSSSEIAVSKQNGNGNAEPGRSEVDPRVGIAYARGNAGNRIKAASLASPNKHGRRTVPVPTGCFPDGACRGAWSVDSRPPPYR